MCSCSALDGQRAYALLLVIGVLAACARLIGADFDEDSPRDLSREPTEPVDADGETTGACATVVCANACGQHPTCPSACSACPSVPRSVVTVPGLPLVRKAVAEISSRGRANSSAGEIRGRLAASSRRLRLGSRSDRCSRHHRGAPERSLVSAACRRSRPGTRPRARATSAASGASGVMVTPRARPRSATCCRGSGLFEVLEAPAHAHARSARAGRLRRRARETSRRTPSADFAVRSEATVRCTRRRRVLDLRRCERC